MLTLNQFQHCNLTDIETTGLVPGKHGIISIAATNLIDDEVFYEELQLEDGVEFDDVALNVNGSNKETLLARTGNPGYLTLKEALIKFADYCCAKKRFVIVGKNPKFDYDHLNKAWSRYFTEKFPLTYRVINWADFALPLILLDGKVIPENGLSSDELSAFLGVEKESKPHIAINGAIQNKKCLLAIIEKYNKLLN
jgi:DNA polymerase III alpha subunit (gram-positive type)